MARRVYGYLPETDGEMPRLLTLVAGSIKQVDAVRSGDDIVLFVPGTDVAIHQQSLPTRGERETRQAAPFAIEDEVATPIVDLHIALGPKPDNLSDPRQILAVDRLLFEAWISRLSGMGLADAKLVSEQSFMPEGRIFDLGSRLVGAVSDGPLAIDTDLPSTVITALMERQEASFESPEDPLATLAVLAEENWDTLIDLRQGEYRVRGSISFAGLKEWRLAGGLVVACAAAWLATVMLDIRAMNTASESLRRQTVEAYTVAFPDNPNPIDPVRAISRELGGAGGAPDINFLDASAVLYMALQEVPEASLRSIRYDTARGGYVASVVYPAYGDDATLKAALETRGYSAVLGDSRRGGQFVIGDVTLQKGGTQ